MTTTLHPRAVWFACLMAVSLGIGSFGCARQESDGGTVAEAEPLYFKNRGVRLPADMHRTLGVETAEVTERAVTETSRALGQVYRPAQGAVRGGALAWLGKPESAGLHIGRPVSLQGPGERTNTLVGTLARLRPSSAEGPAAFEALIEFDDPEGHLKMGSTVSVTWQADRERRAVMVPDGSVIHGAAGAFVYTANGEHFNRTQVVPGARTDGWIEIVDGLLEGDVVVIKAADALWLIELCALKGGTPCCPVPIRGHGG